MYSKQIIVISNTDWFFLLHRLAIANSLKSNDCNVIVAAKDTGVSNKVRSLGFEFVNIDFDRKGINPFKEIKVLYQLYLLLKKPHTQFVYQVTIKPVIYGSIVARFFKIKTINTICGLGYVFSKNETSLLRKVISMAYSNAVNYKDGHTFFENKDDQNLFLELNILQDKKKSTVVNGVGVDLKKYKPFKYAGTNEKLIITLATRMLWDKGVYEFVESAKLLHDKYMGQIEFRLFGMIDKENPESILKKYLKEIEIIDYLKWFGFKDDMVEVYENSNIVVLPSYREGLPTVLAEACAMGLPIVTTSSVGCKECVEEGVNGFKVPIKSIKELAEAIERLILDEGLRIRMGIASRKKAERDFDQKKIVAEYLKVFNSML